MTGVILFGASGRLGSQIEHVLKERDIPYFAPEHKRLDAYGEGSVRSAVRVMNSSLHAQVDTVINCAAFHDTKKTEQQAAEAFRENAYGPQSLARQSAGAECKFVHLSTDYVFGGLPPDNPAGFTSDCPPAPLSTYGASKAAGEFLVMASTYNAMIVRTASLFGSPLDRGDFVKLVRSRVNDRKPMKVVDDVFMSPTYTRDVAYALIAQLLPYDMRGVCHVVSEGGPVTWYEFARTIATLCKAHSDFITPCTLAESGDAFPRPAFSGLVSSSLVTLPNWRTSVESYLNRLDTVESL